MVGRGASEVSDPVSRDVFGTLPDGRAVERITLRGEAGFAVSIIAWGAAVQALLTPDRQGQCDDVVLGHESLEPYLARRDFYGATVGRYANRIAGAAFTLDGEPHVLSANDGPNTLHGGVEGFDRALWRVESVSDEPWPSVVLGHASPDGENGFPGALAIRVRYELTGPQELAITFEAKTDRATVVSLTHHGYFNLAGVLTGGDVLDHELTLFADSYLPVDDGLIPLGAPATVAATPFDFRTPRPIGAAIRVEDLQLRRARGYDHCFVLSREAVGAPRLAARMAHPRSGRMLELSTDQPGLQFYSGNFLDGSSGGKGGRLHRQSDAFCLEPQAWPNAPNRPDYPSARLVPGESYRHRTVLLFRTF
jgi:aldose 1-epimerase